MARTTRSAHDSFNAFIMAFGSSIAPFHLNHPGITSQKKGDVTGKSKSNQGRHRVERGSALSWSREIPMPYLAPPTTFCHINFH
ncbi:hypothetical protein M378DRAFT_165859 [Amanita muscaria Koide BX008]|uniref:Uncharacterized protein n=1 Tax=Amanita muscaria (strain Koide BX008) TaxID=946122 RepID=A0A0C2X0U8_AMAMK|nr:hypothetical protein M378DRAFT_165859 [Amanita muscaria Koide BX008]